MAGVHTRPKPNARQRARRDSKPAFQVEPFPVPVRCALLSLAGAFASIAASKGPGAGVSGAEDASGAGLLFGGSRKLS